jgi:hypothetical protein
MQILFRKLGFRVAGRHDLSNLCTDMRSKVHLTDIIFANEF